MRKAYEFDIDAISFVLLLVHIIVFLGDFCDNKLEDHLRFYDN